MKTITDLTARIFDLRNQIAPLHDELVKLEGELIELALITKEIDDETRREMRKALGLSP